MPPAPQARPTPIFRSLDQARLQGVSLHVTEDSKQVVVGLDGEGFVGSLVEMPVADGPSMQMPTSNVRCGEPLHEQPQLAIVLRPEHKVPVVGHAAKLAEQSGKVNNLTYPLLRKSPSE